MKLTPPTYTIHQNKLKMSKWIKDLNIHRDTVKVLEENIGSKISGNPRSNIFLRARKIKEKINK